MSFSTSSPLGLITGSPPIRLAVNAGFHRYARHRVDQVARANPVETQRQVLLGLVKKASATRFGTDHGFAGIRSVEAFQKGVPIRTYEMLWEQYLKNAYPTLDNLTWPGRIPYFALTSGTTQGATKYIPVSHEMVDSNSKAGLTMIAHHLVHRPDSKLFRGRLFFLGGSTNLEVPATGVKQGDLSGIAAIEVKEALRPYTFPPLELALETNWEKKLASLTERSARERITMVGGVPSWLLVLFERLFQLTGKSKISEVWPHLEMIVHGGVKFDPYKKSFQEVMGDSRIRLQETYPCSEGFIAFGDPDTEHLRLIIDHGLFYEFIPVDELDSPNPTRHWLGNAKVGINYAIVVSTCAGMWGHLIGDTVRFESLDPPLLTFTGRTKYTLSAFGEHLISEEVEGAITKAAEQTGATVSDWHVGPVFQGALGYHQFVVEFRQPPNDLRAFRQALDLDLSERNADYQAHRAEGVGLPLPAILVAQPGGIAAWMRSKGKLGGQHKFPRMDNTGKLTAEISGFLKSSNLTQTELAEGTTS